jgi:hypothetical protein
MPPRPALHFAVAVAVALAACGEDRLIKTPEDEYWVDSLCQLPVSSIDILFVIDNSRSMVEEQRALADNFDRFLSLVDPDPNTAGEEGEVDYRIAVTTTDALVGRGALVGDPQVIRPGAGYSPLEAFRKNVEVGTKGRALEQGLEAALLAVEGARGSGEFVRDRAYLYVIVVSDEEDFSPGDVRYYIRALEQAKGIGNDRAVVVSAIAGPAPDGCESPAGRATPGLRYDQAARATGGVVGSICTEDWQETLRQLAVNGLGLRKRFQLTLPPADYTQNGSVDAYDLIDVVVRYPCGTRDLETYLGECGEVQDTCAEGGDVVCVPYLGHPDGYVYDAIEKMLDFHGAAVPGPGGCVEVTYEPRDL